MGISTVQTCYNDGVTGESCFSPVSLTQEEGAAGSGILWNTNALTSLISLPYGSTAAPAFVFDGSDAAFGSSRVTLSLSAQQKLDVALTDTSFSGGEYVVMYDNITEHFGDDSATLLQINNTSDPGTWYDAANATIDVTDQTANSPQRKGQIYSCDIHVAQDDGAGGPLAGTTVTKRCTFYAWADDPYVLYDGFSDTNGTNITAHSPDVDTTSNGWTALAGGMEIQSGRAVATSANSISTFDPGVSDFACHAKVLSYDQDFALIGRVQDSSNYWQLLVEDADQSDPIVKLNEVSSGTPTTRASETLTGIGPLGSTNAVYLQLVFGGNDIVAKFGLMNFFSNILGEDKYCKLTYTSTSYNTQTKFGIESAGTSTAWDQAFLTERPSDYPEYL